MSSHHLHAVPSGILLGGVLLLPAVSYSQSPKFYLSLTLVDSGSRVSIPYTLHLGVHPNSTKCDDNPNLPLSIVLAGFATRWAEAESSTVIEQDGPPGSPATDIRFSQPPGCGSVPGPYLEDIRPFTSSTQIDTFRLRIQMDGTQSDDIHAIKFAWPSVIGQFADSVILQKTGSGAFRLDMSHQSSYTYRQSILSVGANVTGVTVIMKGPKTPPGLPSISIIEPVDDSTNVSRSPVFQWTAVPQAVYYRFQLATDSLFTHIVRTDSLGGAATSLTQSTNLNPNSTYYWRILVSNPYGVSYYQNPPLKFTTGLVGAIDPVEGPIPGAFALHEAYPNPFNPSTTISFDLRDRVDIELAVYDLMGRKLATIASGRYSAGAYSARWEGTNDAGISVSSGTYLVRLHAFVEGESQSIVVMKKLILMK